MAQAQLKSHEDIKEPLCGDVTELDINPDALDSPYDPHAEQNPTDALPDLEGVEHACALAIQVKASTQTIDLSTTAISSSWGYLASHASVPDLCPPCPSMPFHTVPL